MFGNDQNCWNRENLRELFIGKTYGIIGDSNFYFNPQNGLDLAPIFGYTPIRQKSYTKKMKSLNYPKPTLSERESKRNKELSSLWVVVENVIAQFKHWGIISGKYRYFHYYDGEFKNRIDLNNVVQVCASLTNLKIKKSPLRKTK